MICRVVGGSMQRRIVAVIRMHGDLIMVRL